MSSVESNEPSGADPAAAGLWYEMTLLDALPDAVIIYDRDARAVQCNRAATQLLGIPREQLLGAAIRVFRRPVDAAGHDLGQDELPLYRTLATGEAVEDWLVGMVGPHDRAATEWFTGSCRPLVDEHGLVTAVVTSFRNATELKVGQDIDRGTRDLATALVELPLGQPDTMIEHQLQMLGHICAADRVLYVQLDREAGRARTTHDWSRSGAPLTRIPGGAPIDLLASLLGYVARHRPIVLANREVLTEPTMASARLEAWGLVAAIVAPVMIDGTLDALLIIGWEQPQSPSRQLVDFTVVAADLLAARCERELAHRRLERLAEELAEREAGGRVVRVLADDVDRPEMVLPDLLVEVDDEGRLTEVHQASESVLPSLAAFRGESVIELFEANRRPEIVEKLTRIRETGEPQSFEFDWRIQDHLRRFECRLVAQSGGGVLVVVRDMTELAQWVQQVQDQAASVAGVNDELRRVVRERDEFLASVSHELRTPLNAILGITEMMIEDQDQPLAGSHASSLHTIDQSAQQLRDVINDLLDLSGLRARLVEIQRAPVAIGALCRDCLDLVTPRARQQGLAVEFVDGTAGRTVEGDEARLRQVVLSLLDNAVKFSDAGGRVGVQVWTSGGDRVAFAVWDTGIGMDEADHQRIFEPFTQLDGGLGRLRPGTGLGLALAERLVDLHGGTIEVDSRLGEGCRFTVVLPASPPAG